VRKFRVKQDASAPERKNLEALAKLHAEQKDFLARSEQATVAALEAQMRRYETAIDKISQGICFFDADQRLILCNRRYAEIYHLAPEDVKPGTTLRAITERRFALGTCLMAVVDDYLRWCAEVNSGSVPKTWTADLKDGRKILIIHQPMPDGGWVATHDDITELKRQRAVAKELISLQALIDSMPDSLWVKDAKSRFIIANQTTASENGLAKPQDLIGKTDFDLFAPELAEQFFAIEEKIIQSGQPMIDAEEEILDASGKKWRATTKVPLRDDKNEVFALVGISRDITQLKAQRAVANELISLQTLIDFVPDYLWVKDTESRFVVVNKALMADSGRARTSDIVGLSDHDLHAPDIAQGFLADEQEIMRSGRPLLDKEEYVLDAKGNHKWLLSTKVPLRDENNKIFGLVGIARDITERKKADILRNGQAQILEMIATNTSLENVLDRLVRLIESQLNGIYGSILLLDDDGQTLRHGAAPSLAEVYTKAIDGVKIGPTVGSCGTAVYHRKAVIVTDIMSDPLWKDYRHVAEPHGYRSCWSTPILAHDGSVLGVFAMYSTTVREPAPAETLLVDVAIRIAGIAIERKRAEDRIKFLAHHDALTGLPNRSLLNDRLTQAILQTERYNPWVSVVFVDLDNFKNINDSLGHNAGDQLLKVVAARMVAAVRATDTVMRLGGDEFIILLVDQPDNPAVISATLGRIRSAVAEPMVIEGRTLYVTCSMGVATYPADSENPETLVRNADAAMYKAKEAGRDNVQFYTSEMNAKIHEKLALQQELRNALVRSEFILHYQPQVDLRSGRVFAAEALIRWQHPTQGFLTPVKFIPVAEETGLIVQIGAWVLHEACLQNKAWQDQGLPPISVCVNVSARQFMEKNLISRVVSALRDSGLEAKYLELEITESLIMHDVDQAIATMQALRKLGVQLAIDDFGTGYSSLNALKTFPVARLKIDKSFISNIPANESDKAVAAAVISLGQKLNLRVIAEGVETAEQVEFLQANNCDEIQGYHISKPIGPEAIEKFLKSQSATML
jgi:diguanylate cyclase (GGDEF)-like protein/PAS domain S-box-containing protein